MAYFRREAAERLRPGDKVILITHRPSWLFAGIGDAQLYTNMSMTNLQQFEHDIIHANGLVMPLVLAGDIHHYNRYVSSGTGQQRVTAGAGAAFLYPTNHLVDEFRWPEADGPRSYELKAAYPDTKTSRRLRWGTLLAPFKNPSFVIFVGALYLLVALLVRFAITRAGSVGFTRALRETSPGDVAQSIFNNPGSFIFAVGLAAVMMIFADAPTPFRRFLVGLVHWVFQFTLLVTVIWAVARITLGSPFVTLRFDLFFVDVAVNLDTPLFIIGVVLGGGYLGSQLFALYLFLMFTLFGRHATHAFSSQHIADYRSFLRLKIDSDGALTIYPIGVRKVPRRWRPVGRARQAGEPRFEPDDRAVECHLIEAPIRIEAPASDPTDR